MFKTNMHSGVDFEELDPWMKSSLYCAFSELDFYNIEPSKMHDFLVEVSVFSFIIVTMSVKSFLLVHHRRICIIRSVSVAV